MRLNLIFTRREPLDVADPGSIMAQRGREG